MCLSSESSPPPPPPPPPPHRGWARSTVAGAVALCERSSETLERGGLEVSLEALESIWHQITAAQTRRTAHVHRARAPEYRAAYEGGESLLSIARRAGFSPYLVSRLVLEAALGIPRKAVSELVKKPEMIPDARLRREVEACATADPHYSPRHDAARRDVGLRHERLLESELDKADVPYQREDDLRRRGFAKTPDVLLDVPLAYVFKDDDDDDKGDLGDHHHPKDDDDDDDDDDVRVINWIDSKAMFGLPSTYRDDHRQQLLGYVNRLGPGAVVYWFGFAEELQALDDDVLLLSDWPRDRLYWPDGARVRPPTEDSAPTDKNQTRTFASPPLRKKKENLAPPPPPPPPGLSLLLPRKKEEDDTSKSNTTAPQLPPSSLVARLKPTRIAPMAVTTGAAPAE
eukprot:CAMPEP_0118897208 /NCGR_PEP_ID=MMETSP1166-20130328/4698_1 /TAXON_ID=1104430 /ORGANISM="Chrysoreinhardia sp, Strain CCMP3193" /LENGTH=399 /DNA_ID=CAMNT_0006836273 /DNA_START=8 /DNA_END=1207 /DNA_ORIENTATION=+